MANEYIELPLLSSLQEEQVGSTTDYANVVDLSGNVNIGSVIDDNITGDYQIIDGFYENTTPNEVPYYANTFNSTFKINLNPNSNAITSPYENAEDGRIEYILWEVLYDGQVIDTELKGFFKPVGAYDPTAGQNNNYLLLSAIQNPNTLTYQRSPMNLSGLVESDLTQEIQIRATLGISTLASLTLEQQEGGEGAFGNESGPSFDDTAESRTTGTPGGSTTTPTTTTTGIERLLYTNVLEPISLTIFPRPTSAIRLQATYTSFAAQIESVENNKITINQSWNDYKEKLGNVIETNPNSGYSIGKDANADFLDWTISYKINDRRNLNTYLHLGDDRLSLITNVKSDIQSFPKLPHAIIYKLYEPLPEDLEEKDNVYVVREILPQYTETVELVPYEQEEDVLVLKIPDTPPDASPITKRATELKNYNQLVTTDAELKENIIDKFISGSDKPVELSIEYSQYENFINFSSAQKRLENFKYKIEQIEQQTALSSSFVGVTSGSVQSSIHRSEIRNIKGNFDGYENYLYNTISTYLTSSMGEFYNSSWPKTGSGTYTDPYVPVSSSHADFISWYGSIPGKTGQLYSASLYDTENENRLVNLLPQHISEDKDNSQFLDFMDMIGQQFDELWSYISAMTSITDRQSDLTEGFSKDLIYNLAKSLGWNSNDGKDLLDLSQAGFGQKLEGDSYSLYTSGSLDSPNETDVSKEITKRLISSMPYLLKSKGTIGSLKGLLNIYGIPSSILRIKEYGGLQEPKQRDSFEISRRFTKALGFRGAQYVTSSWSDDSISGRKPETVELRFRSVSGSDQTLIQKDDRWAIRLKDNGSSDNFGTVSFILSGSTGQKEVSSSLLPVFDGDYYSLMLQKRKVETNLFPNPSFEVSSLFNPPFVTQSLADNAFGGEIKIVSSSNVSRTGVNALEHKNNLKTGTSYTLFFNNPSTTFGDSTSSITDATIGQTFTFSAFAKVSSSMVDSIGRLRIFELDSNEEVVNWDEDTSATQQKSLNSIGGVATSNNIGLNETEWKQISVTKTLKYPQTAKLGVRLENVKPDSTIYWDDINVFKNPTNTDTIGDTFNYELFVKKYEAGLDRILFSSETSMLISGSNTASQSFNASWTGSGDLFIGGKPSDEFGNQLTGSIMEFRLWNEPLKEEFFDNHVSNPKSYVGNTPSSSYHSLVTRYSFDDNTILSNGTTIRDVSSNQTTTSTGYAFGFGGLNTFENVEDKTQTMIPNYGPNRRSSTKIRIENNVLSGSSANLSVNERFDISSNDFAPLDSPKVGIYFSPTDVVNEDILLSFANLDFNQYLGDPRDNFKLNYPELKDVANQYFQKYTGKNDFWDYMRLIKYYDQMMFTQIRKLIPARSKPHLGTVIEPNLFERSKNPVQRNQPSFTLNHYEKAINLSNMNFNDEPNVEVSHSVFKISTEYPNYEGTIDSSQTFEKPSLYRFDFNDNYDDRATYVSASMKIGSDREFQEVTMSIVMDSRKSELNQEYKFFYTSSGDFDKSSRYSIDPFENLYTSRSLHISELDTEYQNSSALNRSFYEGVKNTKSTTLDGDLPVVIRTTSPTIAVPSDMGDSNLNVISSGGKSSSGKRSRGFRKKRRGKTNRENK